MKQERNYLHKDNNIDYYFLLNTLILIFIGLIMVYDASVAYSAQTFNLKYKFLIQQLLWLTIGGIGAFLMSKIKLDIVKNASKMIYILGIIFLVITILPLPFSQEIYGARRWLFLNPAPLPSIPFLGRIGFQPSEFMKLATIIYLSTIFTSEKYKLGSMFEKLKLVFMISILPVALILVEPDFTTAFVLLCIIIGMYFFSGAPIIQFIIGVPMIAVISGIYAFSTDYRRERIMTLFKSESSDLQGSGYHIRQIMIALGSGGWSGLGYGRSRQKYSYIPEVSTDSIFAIIGEEFGYLGSLTIIGLFLSLFWRGISIVVKNTNLYAQYISIGVVLWIIIQTVINLSSMVRIIPLTGVPIPFISYGGSSLIFILIGIGLVLNSSRYVKD